MGKYWGWNSGWKHGGWKKKHHRDNDDDRGGHWGHKRWKRDDDDDDRGGFSWKSKWRDNDDWGKKKFSDDHGSKYKKWWGDRDWCKPNPCKKKKVCEPDPEPDPNNAPVIVAPSSTDIMVGDVGVGNGLALVLATDADGDTLVYSIVPEDGGDSADAEFFEMDPDFGELRLAQDVSPLADENGDGVWEVTVQVTDGIDTTSIDLDITFTFGG